MNYNLLLLTVILPINVEAVGFSLDTIRDWISPQHLEESAQEETVSPNTTIIITNHKGSLTVSSWNNPRVMMRAIKKSSQKETLSKARIAIERNKNERAEIPQDELIISAPTEKDIAVDFDIIVPKTAALQITNNDGPIKIKKSGGNIDVTAYNGDIEIYRPTGTVKAHAQQGDILVKLATFEPSSSLLLTTNQGSVTVKAPSSLAAHFSATTKHGKVTSDLTITLEPITTKLTKATYKDMTRSILGTFGNGTAPITIEVQKGDICVEEY